MDSRCLLSIINFFKIDVGLGMSVSLHTIINENGCNFKILISSKIQLNYNLVEFFYVSGEYAKNLYFYPYTVHLSRELKTEKTSYLA